MTRRTLKARPVPEAAYKKLILAGHDPLMARLLASRGIGSPDEMETALQGMLSPDTMRGMSQAVDLLQQALLDYRKICIVADYDCDGATACAIAMRGLAGLGAEVDYLVPNRFEHGYGLQPSIVELCLTHPRLGKPDLLVTVDNGIASISGVQAARNHGLQTLITDHHLAGQTLPQADAIINPNQGGCPFPSKALAGCGVMFYLLIALRSRLRDAPVSADPQWAEKTESLRARASAMRLDALLDLVALGTVADLVALDRNNRILVTQGLKRIQRGQMQAGLKALLQVAGRDPRRLQASDLGFALGPRINAAGRLDDMSLGIECLISDDEAHCQTIAHRLDQINRERRSIEADARASALARLGPLSSALTTSLSTGSGVTAEAGLLGEAPQGPGHIAFDADWHEGVIGLVAGKLKDRLQTPCIVFAPAQATPDGQGRRLKGSGRSIPGVHLRDCLDWVEKQAPQMMIAFGGHAMAAGLSLMEADLPRFEALFRQSLLTIPPPQCFRTVLDHDGELDWSTVNLSLCRQLESVVWGQSFPPPLLFGEFDILKQRLVGEKHLSLSLRPPGRASLPVKGILFNHAQALPGRLKCLYRISENQYQGISEVQVMVEHLIDENGQEIHTEVP